MFLEKQDQKDSFVENFRKKINKVNILDEDEINDSVIQELDNLDCLIIDNFKEQNKRRIFIYVFKSI